MKHYRKKIYSGNTKHVLERSKKFIYKEYDFRRYEHDTSEALVDFSDSAKKDVKDVGFMLQFGVIVSINTLAINLECITIQVHVLVNVAVFKRMSYRS